jgi:hypothetical protein
MPAPGVGAERSVSDYPRGTRGREGTNAEEARRPERQEYRQQCIRAELINFWKIPLQH